MKRISVLAPLLALFALAAEAPPLYVGYFGAGASEAYGQTITAPSTRPYKFSFWINLPAHVGFRGEVRLWTAAGAGALLWASQVQHTNGSGDFERIEFLPATGTEQDPPAACTLECVLLVTVRDVANNPGFGAVEVAREPYAGGEFVFRNRKLDGTQGPWIRGYLRGGDLRFDASVTEAAQ